MLGLLARFWVWTLRVSFVCDGALAHAEDRPWVFAFFHGTQFPMLAWRRRKKTVVLVSLSDDGAMQARALAMNGMAIVRGSSSKRGASGLRALITTMRDDDCDAAFAVDGPRGPYGVAKPGVLAAARATGAVVVPMGAHAERAITLKKAWDRFMLPLPFSRVRVVLGAPLDAADVRDGSLVARAIEKANAEAA
jgi:lysophospholipid acyltransferase (LPLAT)-like uncharacterized protein